MTGKRLLIMMTKNAWGGRREGSGRPKKDNVVLYARVAPHTLEEIKTRADKLGVGVGQYLDGLFR